MTFGDHSITTHQRSFTELVLRLFAEPALRFFAEFTLSAM